MNNELFKKEALQEIENIKERLMNLSKKIHANPELSGCEFNASQWIANELERENFDIQLGISTLDTAVKACYFQSSESPTIAFMAEYDALPEIGHGCGHNLIAPAAIGAAAALKNVLPPGFANVMVIGTPAEETFGGKLPLLEAGVFDNVDVAMMFHPHTITTGLRPCTGRTSLVFEFFGKPAHAATFPDKGINALDAVILTFNNINALRQQLREDVRIHGIITDGGKVTNIIPDYSRAEFFVRSRDKAYMEEVIEKVKNCANGAAIATGAELKVSSALPTYLPDIPVDSLIECFEGNLKSLGHSVQKVSAPFRLGSSDFGNVSQCIPSLMGFISIAADGTPTHSSLFREAAISERGLNAMVDAARAMAMTAIDIITNPGLLEQIKHEFERGMGARHSTY
jgi:amidohydrolase